MLVELKKSALLKSRKGCGGGFKGGRKNFYHKQAKRFLSKPLFKLYQCILQVVSNSPRGYQNKIYWVKWDTLCRPKAHGEQGLHDLEKFIDALLGKQVRRLFSIL